MRICFYNVTATYLSGGLETYCWEAGRALARRGHAVSIVAGNRGAARHDEVRLAHFPFRAEKEWPDFGRVIEAFLPKPAIRVVPVGATIEAKAGSRPSSDTSVTRSRVVKPGSHRR